LTADKSSRPAPPSKSGRKGEKDGAETPVSNALRSAYEEAVKEDVPAEFLDLLGKLS
jgi:hypothetical protein